jgi:transposase
MGKRLIGNSKLMNLMDIHHYLGIDVSKNTLDWAVYANNGIIWQTQSENSPAAIRAVIKQLQALAGFSCSTSICCMEHTGIYNAHVLEVLFEVRLPIWLEASAQIKQASGLQRGKSDSVMLNALLSTRTAFVTGSGFGNQLVLP